MAKFITFDINQVIINNNLFPANSLGFQLSSNTVPVKDINGNLLYYAPTSPIQGSVSVNFFLTGAIPSYLRLENQSEVPTSIAFNQLYIPDCYLTNLSLSVRPFEPIPVKADFVFYHGVRALNTDSIVLNSLGAAQTAPGINNINQAFTSGLNILKGMSSYILTDDRSTWVQNATDFVVTDFDYQFSVERVPILRAGDSFPLRVAMKEINAEFNITTNNLDGVLDIHGNSAVFSAVLRDNTDTSISDTINLTGIIASQSYEISEDNYGFSKIKMMQSLNRKRSSITIPMEVDNPNIINPPTVNNNGPIVIPGSAVTSKEIKDSTAPNTEDPKFGTGTSNPPSEVDNEEWYYVSVTVQATMIDAQNAGCNSMKLVSAAAFTKLNSNNMRFEVMSASFDVTFDPKQDKYQTNEGLDISKKFNYSKRCPILSLKVNKTFLDNFLNSELYLDNTSVLFINYINFPCNPARATDEEYYPREQTYAMFFNGNFFNALNDTYKNKETPYEHYIGVYNNADYNLYANY